jgi:hypothetical protein
MNASKMDALIASLSSTTCRSVQRRRASSGVGSFLSSNVIPNFFCSTVSVWISAPETMERLVPFLPMRPVRPTRWRNTAGSSGKE